MRILAASILISLLVVNVSALTSAKATQCINDLQNSSNTVCTDADTACKTALSTAGTCLTTCSTGTDTSDAYIIKCIKNSCKSTNTSVQSMLDKFLTCVSVSNLTFTALLLAVFALLF